MYANLCQWGLRIHRCLQYLSIQRLGPRQLQPRSTFFSQCLAFQERSGLLDHDYPWNPNPTLTFFRTQIIGRNDVGRAVSSMPALHLLHLLPLPQRCSLATAREVSPLSHLTYLPRSSPEAPLQDGTRREWEGPYPANGRFEPFPCDHHGGGYGPR